MDSACPCCRRVKCSFGEVSSDPVVIVFHTSRSVLIGRKSKEKVNLLKKLAERATALRNVSGGILLVHVEGQEAWDRDLEIFDEAIGKRFGELIEDGSLFTDCFSRLWLSDIQNFERETDFLVYTIAETKCVSTLNFNTKIRNDFENERPSFLNIVRMLLRGNADKYPYLRGLQRQHMTRVPNSIPLFENRAIELKAFTQHQLTKKPVSVDEITDYIWNDLKLKDNVSSMSKLPEGGSFYIGVTESSHKTDQYKTKIRTATGFNPLVDIDQLTCSLYEKTRSDMVVLSAGDKAFHEPPPDLIDVLVHCVDDQGPLYVLQVVINSFDGIVFHDKQGPEAYTITDGQISIMARDEWLNRLMNCELWKACERFTKKVIPKMPKQEIQ
ncbi:uncharacterized protein LOC124259021 isoform X2 [Haliotis rubra]|nr:uncharacterized protein LOC124259021 isoform X2 [Haliotis rubra]XP_046549071.1 uncharacterized protein LOC124259021 isoform X2 [Haliotis rubra]